MGINVRLLYYRILVVMNLIKLNHGKQVLAWSKIPCTYEAES